ncbi:CLUMA_CG020177, isoform A [Clunio marinus]|uniref:CLUMA_CG020177, isoform A n=1 Tax=Clunio marinus TaxID=568069 RepID=A0A1J1J5G1_9DIPT|nr:CLUMA_CG020177, isoform A [Clunio marinus]
MGNFNINKMLLPMKAHYYLFNAGTAPVVPFIPVLAKQLGYPASVIGIIYFVLPVVGMLAKPIFGAIADRFHRQKFLFIFFQFLIIISFTGILFVPKIPSNGEFHCHEGENLMKMCSKKNNNSSYCINETNIEAQTYKCSLSCLRNEQWHSICESWKVKDICDSTDKNINIETNVSFEKKSIFNDCLYLFIHNGTIKNQESTLYCPSSHKDEPVVKMKCDMICNDDTINEVLIGATDIEVKSRYQFWIFFFLLIISWTGMAVVVSIGDAICFEMLGDKPQRYGYQRLWGSVGWGTLSIISGLLIDKFSEGQSVKNYTVGFLLMGVIIFLDMGVSMKLKYTQVKISPNILKDVTQIFASFRVIIFFIWCIVIGMGTALIWNFLFWHLEELGEKSNCGTGDSMKTLQGLVMGIQCFGGELPFFFISGRLLKKIGHVNAMNLVLFGFGVRFFFYSILKDPWLVLPVELLNGITFGIFYATMASYASIIAPVGTEATMQGLVGAVFEGIGVSTGSIIGGKLFENIGGSNTFSIFSYGAFICLLVHWIVQNIITKIYGRSDMRNEYQEPYNSIATEAFSILDDNDLQTPSNK